MAVLSFPAVFRVSGAVMRRIVPKAATVSPFSGARQVVVYGPGFWRAELPLTPHRPAEADIIDAFLDSLQGELNQVQFAGADFNRPSGPGILTWSLDPDSVVALPRARGGYSDPATVVFREVL